MKNDGQKFQNDMCSHIRMYALICFLLVWHFGNIHLLPMMLLPIVYNLINESHQGWAIK